MRHHHNVWFACAAMGVNGFLIGLMVGDAINRPRIERINAAWNREIDNRQALIQQLMAKDGGSALEVVSGTGWILSHPVPIGYRDPRCDGPARYEAMREAHEAGRPQPC